jgi:hypothetical protein
MLSLPSHRKSQIQLRQPGGWKEVRDASGSVFWVAPQDGYNTWNRPGDTKENRARGRAERANARAPRGCCGGRPEPPHQGSVRDLGRHASGLRDSDHAASGHRLREVTVDRLTSNELNEQLIESGQDTGGSAEVRRSRLRSHRSAAAIASSLDREAKALAAMSPSMARRATLALVHSKRGIIHLGAAAEAEAVKLKLLGSLKRNASSLDAEHGHETGAAPARHSNAGQHSSGGTSSRNQKTPLGAPSSKQLPTFEAHREFIAAAAAAAAGQVAGGRVGAADLHGAPHEHPATISKICTRGGAVRGAAGGDDGAWRRREWSAGSSEFGSFQSAREASLSSNGGSFHSAGGGSAAELGRTVSSQSDDDVFEDAQQVPGRGRPGGASEPARAHPKPPSQSPRRPTSAQPPAGSHLRQSASGQPEVLVTELGTLTALGSPPLPRPAPHRHAAATSSSATIYRSLQSAADQPAHDGPAVLPWRLPPAKPLHEPAMEDSPVSNGTDEFYDVMDWPDRDVYELV